MAADRIGRADAVHQALRDGLQQPVANGVTLRVIDVLELVEVEEEEGRRGVVAPGQGDRLGDAVVQQRPIRKAGKKIVLCQMPHSGGQGHRVGNIPEHHHGADELTVPVVDGGGRVFDWNALAMAGHENGVAAQVQGLVAMQDMVDGIGDRVPAAGVDEREDVGDRQSPRFGAGPATHRLGRGVQIIHTPRHVDRDDGVGDGIERDFGACLGDIYATLHLHALDDVAQRLWHQVIVVVAPGQPALRAALDCFDGICLVIESAQRQDRGVASPRVEPVEAGQPLGIFEQQIHQDRIDRAAADTAQSVQHAGRGLDLEGAIACVGQGALQRADIVWAGRKNQDSKRHGVSGCRRSPTHESVTPDVSTSENDDER